jgi:hypothetical protein
MMKRLGFKGLRIKKFFFFIQSRDFLSILHTSHTICSFIKASTVTVDDPSADEPLFIKDEERKKKDEQFKERRRKPLEWQKVQCVMQYRYKWSV